MNKKKKNSLSVAYPLSDSAYLIISQRAALPLIMGGGIVNAMPEMNKHMSIFLYKYILIQFSHLTFVTVLSYL